MANESVSDNSSKWHAQPTEKSSSNNAWNEVHSARTASSVPVVDLNDMNHALYDKGVLPGLQITGADTASGTISLTTMTSDRKRSLHDIELDLKDPDLKVHNLAKEAADYFKKVIADVDASSSSEDPTKKQTEDIGRVRSGGENGEAGAARHLNDTVQTYSDGSTRRFSHDTNGKLTGIENPDGSQWQVNDNGSWSYLDNKGNKVFDSNYRPQVKADGTVITTEQDGSQTTIKPDGSGQQKRADGSTVMMNQHGDVTEVDYPGGSKRTFTYDADHKLATMTDTNGQTSKVGDGTTVGYDGKLTIKYGNNSSNEYKTDGSVVAKDDKGHVTNVHYLNGSDRKFEYDGDTVKSVTEPDGKKWVKGTDGQYHEQDKDGKDTGWTKDFTPTVDGNGNYTAKNPDGSTELKKTDGSSVAAGKDGLVTEVDYADGKKATFGYTDGKLTSMVDKDGKNWHLDDKDGWVIKGNGFLDGDKKQQDGPMLVRADGTIQFNNGSDVLVTTGGRTVNTPDSTEHSLYGTHSDDPLKAITPDAVHQGSLGDCYFLAAVASVAQQNPQAIKDMIKDNKDGTYTVTFPGDPDHPVTVNEPTPEELAKYAKDDNKNGEWVNVLEKAHRQYTGRDKEDKGDSTEAGLELLTPKSQGVKVDGFTFWEESGHIGNFHFGKTSEEDTGKALEEAMKDHKAVTASATDGNFLTKILGASNDPQGKVVGDHVYAVIGYDAKTQTVTLRNPWGGEGGVNGTFTMSLHDFHEYMTDMALQK